jgi:hypothetical protein
MTHLLIATNLKVQLDFLQSIALWNSYSESDLVSMLTVAVSGGYVNLGPTYFPLIKLNKEVKCAPKI